MDAITIRSKLLASGVKSLREFGYPHVNMANILTDCIFARFFKGILEDEREELVKRGGRTIQEVVDALIAECETAKLPPDRPKKGKKGGATT